MGVLIQAVIVNIGLYFIIMELNQCMIYFDTIKNNLTENFGSTPLINSIILKLLFFDKKNINITNSLTNSKVINLARKGDIDINSTPFFNFTGLHLTQEKLEIANNQEHVPITTEELLIKKAPTFNFTKILRPGNLYVSDLYSENIIYEFVLNIYYPILFVCFIVLIKVSIYNIN